MKKEYKATFSKGEIKTRKSDHDYLVAWGHRWGNGQLGATGFSSKLNPTVINIPYYDLKDNDFKQPVIEIVKVERIK